MQSSGKEEVTGANATVPPVIDGSGTTKLDGMVVPARIESALMAMVWPLPTFTGPLS